MEAIVAASSGASCRLWAMTSTPLVAATLPCSTVTVWVSTFSPYLWAVSVRAFRVQASMVVLSGAEP